MKKLVFRVVENGENVIGGLKNGVKLEVVDLITLSETY